jgi:hypothetical protein
LCGYHAVGRNQVVGGNLVSAMTAPDVIEQRVSPRVQPTRWS